jgi:hypothetical protein
VWARLDIQLGPAAAPRPGAPDVREERGAGPGNHRASPHQQHHHDEPRTHQDRHQQRDQPDRRHRGRKRPSARERDARRRQEWLEKRRQRAEAAAAPLALTWQPDEEEEAAGDQTMASGDQTLLEAEWDGSRPEGEEVVLATQTNNEGDEEQQEEVGQELPATPILAATSYQELLVAPSSLTLHLPAEEGDCLTALVTTRHLVIRGLEKIPQLDGKDDPPFEKRWHCYEQCTADNKHHALCDELSAIPSYQALKVGFENR